MQGHQIRININEKLPLFKLDFGLMEQVLYNLLLNASIYTEPGTIITISADCSPEVKGHFTGDLNHLVPQRDVVANSLILQVSDTGRGFPPVEIDKVFDKFYRLKNSKTGGTGL